MYSQAVCALSVRKGCSQAGNGLLPSQLFALMPKLGFTFPQRPQVPCGHCTPRRPLSQPMPQVGADLKGLQEFPHALAYLICTGNKAWEPDRAHIMLCLEQVPEREKCPRASASSPPCWHLHPTQWRDIIPKGLTAWTWEAKAPRFASKFIDSC